MKRTLASATILVGLAAGLIATGAPANGEPVPVPPPYNHWCC
jgi:hypothetical protein